MEELIELLLSGDQKIRSLYSDLARGAREIISGYKGPMGRNNALLRGPMERLLKKFRTRLYFLLHFNIQRAQSLAYTQIEDLLKKYPHRDLSHPPLVLKEVKTKLSERVWELSRENGRLMRCYVEYGLREGTSASEMTKDLRKFLREPEKLFRRIRNEKGALALSRAAKEYRPGRGVYRSSYKNALRLARTQVNMTYHRVQYERWQKLPFVLGIEVRLSKVHKQGACICDHLQGRYPKNFLFLGWHPQCLCQGIPVLLSRDEFIRYSKTGKVDPSKYIREIPKKAQEYLNTHAEQIRRWKNKPYFIADNFKYIEGKGFIYKGL